MIEYVQTEPDEVEVEREGPCRCGGTFQLGTLFEPFGGEIPHLSHSLPTCAHFDTLEPSRYLVWNSKQGMTN